jgi:diguanylate cyclase (GGDEF)-like protein
MRQKLLIIDDSPPIHELVKTCLKYDPVDTVNAFDGPAGLDFAAAQAPDLILLDVDMPGIDGFEVCRRLKDGRETCEIPVLFLTSCGMSRQKVRGLSLGAVDYVTKPFDPAELRARLCASLRRKQRHDLMARKVMVDELTHLWNRAYFDHRMQALACEAKRYKHPLSCIAIDIDRLAGVNNRLGDKAGDQVLRAVAQRLVENSRIEDTVSRMEAGAFAILAPRITGPAALRFAERLWLALGPRPVLHCELAINVKCSFGVASMEVPVGAQLLQEARSALDRAKRSGGGRVVMFRQGVKDVSVAA